MTKRASARCSPIPASPAAAPARARPRPGWCPWAIRSGHRSPGDHPAAQGASAAPPPSGSRAWASPPARTPLPRPWREAIRAKNGGDLPTPPAPAGQARRAHFPGPGQAGQILPRVRREAGARGRLRHLPELRILQMRLTDLPKSVSIILIRILNRLKFY